MDNNKVIIRHTEKYGKALFASDDIKKDEVIADWTDGRVYEAQKATELPNDPPRFVQDHAIQFARNKYIDYDGIGRYFSHSCDPNCGFQGKFKLVAMRDIKKGEGLSFDYEMSEDSDWALHCLCGSKKCREKIGSFRNMPEATRKQYNGYVSEWLQEEYHVAEE